jgi:dihydrofolate synthase/folylpolyglutamate synthase
VSDAFGYLLSLEKFGIKFGLASIRTICEALGHPEASYPSVVVGGTNGKGSVTAMVDCALRAAGLKSARYTSPHLVRLEERFVIDGRPVHTPDLAEVILEIRQIVDSLVGTGALETSPTFFEVTTAVAFELFRRAGVDCAVLEVGLGGRLDSTNVVEPIAVAITSIDFDHEQYLGQTLAAIAAEKAGIVRPGIPVVTGRMEPEALDVIASKCAEHGARIVPAATGVHIAASTESGRTTITLRTPSVDYGQIPLGLRGEHQIGNAVVAARLLEEVAGYFSLGRDAIIAGLRDVQWPGRLQLIEIAPARRLLLDGAHNPAGAAALAAYLRREFPERLPVVFAAMQDKDAGRMLDALLPAASAVVCTTPHIRRARTAEGLAETARLRNPGLNVMVEPDPEAALESAWTLGPTVCAAGSIFLVGELLEILESRRQTA